MADQTKIQLTGLSSYGEDASRINSADKAVNIFLDEGGYLRSRGGLSSITTVPISGASLPNAQIDGLFYWVSKDITMIVSNGYLFKLDASDNLTSIGNGLETSGTASFAIVRTNTGVESLAVANGGDIYLYDPINTTWQNIYNLDGDTPRNVIKVVFLDGFLVALPLNSNKFYWSSIGDPVDWSALNFASAEANADNIENMIVKGFYLYLLGSVTTEVWYQSGDSANPFLRLDGGLIENGSSSPYTLTVVEDNLYFFDYNRRICRLNQNGYEILSDAIGKFLQTFDSIDDAYSYPIYHQGRVFYVTTFPSSSRTTWDGSAQTGLTFVYDIKNQQIFEWANWTGTEFGSFPIFSQSYASKQQRQILGATSGGVIYKLDDTIFQDGGSDMKAQYVTGNVDFGILNRKRIRKMRFRMDAGENGIDTSLSIYYKRDGQSSYENARTFSLDSTSTTYNTFHGQLNSMGIARIWQLKIETVSNAPLCIGDVTCEIDVMRS